MVATKVPSGSDSLHLCDFNSWVAVGYAEDTGERQAYDGDGWREHQPGGLRITPLDPLRHAT